MGGGLHAKLKTQETHFLSFFFFFLSFFVFFVVVLLFVVVVAISWAAPAAYGGSQAKG